MARPNRVILPGVPVHIIQRGHNRARCFYSTRDFEEYRQVLVEASQRFRCAIHAYVLMTNHVHLLVSGIDAAGPSRMMQMVGRRYVQSVNLRRRRTGTLWEGRFRSSVINSERYFLTCSRYIELNPVRAGIVDRVDQYRWSSYRHNAQGEPDELISPHSLYDALGRSSQLRREAYQALFAHRIDRESLDHIREAGKRGTVLGDANFVERLEALTRCRVARFPHGGDRKSSIFNSIAHL